MPLQTTLTISLIKIKNKIKDNLWISLIALQNNPLSNKNYNLKVNEVDNGHSILHFF